MYLTQGAAAKIYFRLVASSDHLSPVTGASPGALLLVKNGGAAAIPDGNTVGECGGGWYVIDLTAVDTDTAGPCLLLATTKSGSDVAGVPFVVGPCPALLSNGAHGGTSASLRLGGSTSTPPLYVTNSGGDAVQFESTGGNGQGFDLVGAGSGAGFRATGGASGNGMTTTGGATAGNGLDCRAGNAGGNGLFVYAESEAFWIESSGSIAVEINGNTVGVAVYGPSPVVFQATGNGPSVTLEKNGTTDLGFLRGYILGDTDVGPTVTVTASDPGLVTGYSVCRDADGAAEADVTVTLTPVSVGLGANGIAHDGTPRESVSAEDGLVQWTGLQPGLDYRIRRGDRGQSRTFTIPLGTTGTYEFPSIIGGD